MDTRTLQAMLDKLESITPSSDRKPDVDKAKNALKRLIAAQKGK